MTAGVAAALLIPAAATVLTVKTNPDKALQQLESQTANGRTLLQQAAYRGSSDVKASAGDVNSTASKKTAVLPCAFGQTPKQNDGSTFTWTFENWDGWEKFNLNNDEREWIITDADGNRCAAINYNSNLAMDDWMISPGIYLEAGYSYEITIDSWAKSTSYTEVLGLYMGTSQTPEAMTIPIQAETDITTASMAEPQVVGTVIVPPTSGTYYIGVHAASPKDTYVLFADNLKVSSKMSAAMPSPVENFSATTTETEGEVVVSMNAPTTTFAGNDLSSLEKVELRRNGDLIKTWSNPAPGEALNYTETLGAGRYTYSATATNADGTSTAVSATVLVTGTAAVPYYKDFPTLSSMDEMTIIDADNDGNTWKWDQYQHYAALSSPDGGSDDWLISIPIRLEAGKLYEFYSLVSAGNPTAFMPKVAFYVGNAPTVEAMTQAIVPPTDITAYDTNFNESFSVPETGKYYIGVHGCSVNYLALIKLMYFGINGGADINGPAAVMDWTIDPDWSARTNNVNVSFTAPVTTGAGDPLSSITKIEIRRDGSVVNTIENPTPGNQYAVTDDAGAAGQYTYKIVPFNSVGQGTSVEATIEVAQAGNEPTYVEDFSSETRFEKLILIDNNQDGTSYWHATLTEPPYAWIHYGGPQGSQTNDDYLILPPMKVEENTIYKFSADVRGYGEGFRLLAGEGPKVDLLSTEVVPLTNAGDEFDTYAGTFTAPYSGNYYIAFHAYSQQRTSDVNVANIRFEKVGSTAGPKAITDFAYTNEGNSLSFTFKAPTQNLAGNALTGITKIVAKRGNTEVQVFDAPAPGAELTFTDEPGVQGEVTYTITGYVDDNQGETFTQVAFVGLDKPATPQNVQAEYLGNGKVKITWDPVTTTAHGATKPAAKYLLLEVNGDAQTQIGSTTANEYEYTAVDPEEQACLWYAIFPVNENDEQGQYGVSGDVYAGKPYTLAYLESFADGNPWSILRIQNLVLDPAWSLATSASFSDVQPYDGDNGFIGMKGSAPSEGRISTGLIDLTTNAVNPAFSLAAYAIKPDDPDYNNKVAIDIAEGQSTEWTELGVYELKDLTNEAKWVRISQDLTAYKGKNVRIGVRVIGGSMYMWNLMDAFRVGNVNEKDLSASISSNVKSVNAGENARIVVNVMNNGTVKADAYTVRLFKDGKQVAQSNRQNLEPYAQKPIIYNQTLDITDGDNVEFYAVVDFEGDQFTTDNTSKTVSVQVVKPIYPTVRDLSAQETSQNNVTVSWSEPSMDNVAPQPYEETFETAESYSQTGANGFTFVDRDGAPTGGFQQFEFPGVVTQQTVLAYFVIDKTESSLGQYAASFAGYNGSNKSLGSFLRYDGGASDDWAVSPELYGGPQIVSFYAKNYLDSYPEILQVFYSTGSTDPDDFIAVGEPKVISSGDWELVSAYVPAGAKRFAIRKTSATGALAMIDNVSFRRAGDTPEALQLVGYNVYRDGERVNNEPVATTTYADNGVEAGDHTYAVSALYEQGESDTARVNMGVVSVGMETMTAVSAEGVRGKVLINGAEGMKVVVTTLDGVVLYNGAGSDNMQVNAGAGIVLVKAGNETFKVVVK